MTTKEVNIAQSHAIYYIRTLDKLIPELRKLTSMTLYYEYNIKEDKWQLVAKHGNIPTYLISEASLVEFWKAVTDLSLVFDVYKREDK